MPFDALTILRGKNNASPAVLVDLETGDVQATTVAPNADGNCIVDLKKTGKKGLAIVMVLPTEPVGYQDTLAVLIEESDHLDRGWQTLLTFPTLLCYLRQMEATATQVFVVADIGKVLISTDDASAVGKVVSFDQSLCHVGGYGTIVTVMQTVADVYDKAGDTLTVTGAAGGIATQGLADRVKPTKGIYIRRLITDKRYVRGKYTIVDTSTGANFGKMQLLIGDDQLNVL